MSAKHSATQSAFVLVALASLAVAVTRAGQTAPSVPSRAAAQTAPGPDAVWSLAAVGDAIITRRIGQFDDGHDPRFRDMVNVVRGADAAFLNLEISLFRLSEFTGWPEVENGGNWELGPPEAAHDLKALGFDLFNHANNHTTDYGVAGMRATNRLLDELGLVHAGTGENLGQASRPGYLETRKGRIALIGLATTFTPMSRAGAVRPDLVGRPGLNALRVERRYQADATTFGSLRHAASSFGTRLPQDPDAPFRIFGTQVERGSETKVIETLNARDQERILREVRNATQLADYVIVSSHSHEPGNDSVTPTQWMVEFSRRCLDAGATAFIVHGPHQLRGVEIYKGKPIFYSLGNFVFQNETIDPMPSDNYEQYGLPDTALASDLYDARFKGGTTGFPSSPVWYESVVALATFKRNQLIELTLHPIDLGQTAPRSQRGTPRLAEATTGQKIVERIARLSASFGAPIVYEKGVGVWRTTTAPSAASAALALREESHR